MARHKIRNPKSEDRKKAEIRKPNKEKTGGRVLFEVEFGIA